MFQAASSDMVICGLLRIRTTL